MQCYEFIYSNIVTDSLRLCPVSTDIFQLELSHYSRHHSLKTQISSLASSIAGSVSVSETSQNTGNVHDGTHMFPCVSGASV